MGLELRARSFTAGRASQFFGVPIMARIGSFTLLAVFATLTAGLLVAEEKPQASAETVQDLVFFADKQPVLIRLRVVVDGKPFRAGYQAAADAYVRGLFKHLDRNG